MERRCFRRDIKKSGVQLGEVHRDNGKIGGGVVNGSFRFMSLDRETLGKEILGFEIVIPVVLSRRRDQSLLFLVRVLATRL